MLVQITMMQADASAQLNRPDVDWHRDARVVAAGHCDASCGCPDCGLPECGCPDDCCASCGVPDCGCADDCCASCGVPDCGCPEECYDPCCDVGCGDGVSGSCFDWRDTFSGFLGYEGSKQPQDFGINANFGGRAALNWGAPLVKKWGVGFQIGTAFNGTANALQVMERTEGTSDRQQSFTTVALFQRSDWCINWALGYDFLEQDYFDDFSLGQWRGQAGLQLTDADELGVKASINEQSDAGLFGATAVRLTPISQGAVFWRHRFETGALIGCWFGLAEGHNEPNAALGDLTRQEDVFVYGTDMFVPLNDHLAAFGEANWLTPADTGSVDAYLGVEIYPWGGAKRIKRNRYAPMLPVANNTSFAVDLARE